MKFFIKKSKLLCFFIALFLINNNALGKSSFEEYSKDTFSNYLSGLIYLKQNHTRTAFKHFKKVKPLKDIHTSYNTKFIHTHILLEKFDKARAFSASVWKEDEILFEADLLLGLDYFIKKDYKNAKKHFERLKNVSPYDSSFGDLFGNILISWVEASKNNKNKSLKLLEEIPYTFQSLKLIQNSFLQCYFDTNQTRSDFKKIIENKNYNFARYNFFLTNYLLHKNEKVEAQKFIIKNNEINNSNLLTKQTKFFFLNKSDEKIKNIFNCQNPKDNIAEFFYIIANLYSSENDYQLSNFYLKISLFLNKKFTPNKTLLAENLYFQKKYEAAIEINDSLKSIGEVYSWYASRRTAIILLKTKGEKKAIKSLKKEFDLISNPGHQHYYEMGNFYRDNKYYTESIQYYSLALNNLKEGHFLIPKILERRGISYERLGDFDNAEKDLLESLKISPNEAHVLNYLAYTWVEKGKNINKALKMLEQAITLSNNDGYIIDSLGWAHFMNKNYSDAEKYLQIALSILPSDPTVSDHYADVLWMLNKNMQARYLWKQILNLEDATQELKDKVSKKIIFGINKEL